MLPLARFAFAASLGLSLSCLPQDLAAQDAFQSALPKSTVLYSGAPDLPHAVEGFKASALYKIWSAEEVQEFFADLMDEGMKRFDMGMKQAKAMHEAGMLPVDPAKVLDLRVQGVQFALTDAELPGQNGPGRLSMVFCLDFGDTAKDAKAIFSALTQFGLMSMGPQAPKVQSQDVGGAKLNTLALPGVPPFLSFNWCFAGSRLLIGTDTARIADITKKLAAGEAGGWLSSESYKNLAHGIRTPGAAMEMYVDLEKLWDLGMGGLQMAKMMAPNEDVDFDGIARVIDVLGIRAFKGMGIVSGYDDAGKGYFKSFLACPEAERKGLSALVTSGAKIDRNRLALVPKDCSSFSLGAWPDLGKLYGTVMDAVKAYDPNVHKMVTAQVGQMEQALGLDIKGTLGSFGPDFAMYSKPVAGMMSAPEMAIMIGCKNADTTLSNLKKLAALSDGVVEISENKSDDGTFYTIDIVLDGMGGMDPTAFIEPTFAFHQGQMVFAFSRTDVKDAMKRLSGKLAEGDDIRSNPVFKPLLQRLPENCDAVAFTDVAATVDGIYGVLSGVLSGIPIPADVPVDLGLLPEVDTITEPLSGSLTWSQTDKTGVRGNYTGPFGPEMLVFASAAIIGGTAALGFAQSRKMGGIRRIK